MQSRLVNDDPIPLHFQSSIYGIRGKSLHFEVYAIEGERGVRSVNFAYVL